MESLKFQLHVIMLEIEAEISAKVYPSIWAIGVQIKSLSENLIKKNAILDALTMVEVYET